MTQDTSNIRLRIPVPLLDKVTEIAKKNQRSVNAEILARLEAAYRWAEYDPEEMAGGIKLLEEDMAEVKRILLRLGLFDQYEAKFGRK